METYSEYSEAILNLNEKNSNFEKNLRMPISISINVHIILKPITINILVIHSNKSTEISN